MKYFVIMWCGAALFLLIGISVMRKKTPARLSFLTKLSPDKVTDIPAYNKAVGKMWITASVLLLADGVLAVCKPAISVMAFAVFCVAGVGGFVWMQEKIEGKYVLK